MQRFLTEEPISEMAHELAVRLDHVPGPVLRYVHHHDRHASYNRQHGACRALAHHQLSGQQPENVDHQRRWRPRTAGCTNRPPSGRL
jgi:hypothetical protein